MSHLVISRLVIYVTKYINIMITIIAIIIIRIIIKNNNAIIHVLSVHIGELGRRAKKWFVWPPQALGLLPDSKQWHVSIST